MKTIDYHLVNRMDPEDREGDLKVGPSPVYRDETSFDFLCKLISDRALLCEGDVASILQAFITKATLLLLNSRAVQMGQFGYLTAAIRTDQVEKADDYLTSNIRKSHVVFIAGPQLHALLKRAKFHQLKKEA